MTVKFLPEEKVAGFLGAVLADRTVYGPVEKEGRFRLARVEPGEVVVPPHRTLDPLKALFFEPRKDMGGYFEDSQVSAPEPRAVVGATACDVASLRILDHVFLEGDYEDPFYKAARDNTFMVVVDCTEPAEVCFCPFVEGGPAAQGGDIILSPIEGGCLVEICSPQAVELAGKAGGLSDASDEQLAERDARRRETAEKVRSRVRAAGLEGDGRIQEAVAKSAHDPVWGRLAEKCVECAACNLVCPTCHCFLLVDLETRKGFKRFRNWDACMYPAFAREASGANPRARRAERLHGRLQKKFDFLKTNSGAWGCVGCGRCIEACAGDIDVRETLRELLNAEPVSAD